MSVTSPLVFDLKFLGSFQLGQGFHLQVLPGKVLECLKNTKEGRREGGRDGEREGGKEGWREGWKEG